LLLLALLPLIGAVLWRRRRPRSGVRLSTVAPIPGWHPGWRARWRPRLAFVRLLALALLVVALARPQTVNADARIETQGIDIALAFDISGSMQEPGLEARTKMEAARKAVKDFIVGRENDRLALVVFRSEARILAPLTLDYRALSQMLDQVEEQNSHLQDGTAIGLGIANATTLLRNSRSKSRILILATDGQNNSGDISPDQAAAIAATLGIRLYTIGIPTANARAEATLDEQDMQRYSERTGGAYARATDAAQLRELYDRVASLEKTRFERERLLQYTELAPYLLLPGLALVLFEVLLGLTFFRTAP
jgi:Ca-activated chloride channel family protein